MIIINKQLKIPESFKYHDIEIKCVHGFKLLGVTIDKKFNFNSHIANISHYIKSNCFLLKGFSICHFQLKLNFSKHFSFFYPTLIRN